MTETLGRVVDVDDPATWPEKLAAQVLKLADQVRVTANDLSELACSDLAVWEQEDDICRLLDGYLLRAYHATHLLPHEADSIRDQGLRILDPELVKNRLTTPLACTGSSLPGGGEGIYWRHADHDNTLSGKLQLLGLPTIVVAQLDLTIPTNVLVFPGVANAFVGTALGLGDVGGDIYYFSPVPAAHIERLIHPRESDYPEHPDLPQHWSAVKLAHRNRLPSRLLH